MSIAALLERLGYRAEWFVEPRQALLRYQERPADFSLVLTDLTMPEMTGIELASAVHAVTPHMPIVVMTGFEGEQSEHSLYTYGVKRLLLKPLSAARIAQCLHACLEQSASHARASFSSV
jgi:DNA-binding NtrC family response regulator